MFPFNIPSHLSIRGKKRNNVTSLSFANRDEGIKARLPRNPEFSNPNTRLIQIGKSLSFHCQHLASPTNLSISVCLFKRNNSSCWNSLSKFQRLSNTLASHKNGCSWLLSLRKFQTTNLITLWQWSLPERWQFPHLSACYTAASHLWYLYY